MAAATDKTPETLRELALTALRHTPTPQQSEIIEVFSHFATSRGPREAMVINGYAGTGKTSVVGALVEAMVALGKKPVVVAPTGRAAKVAAKFSPVRPSTIHKLIYRSAGFDPTCSEFVLAENRKRDTVFFVDEASMITDYESKSLLLDLVQYVYSAPGCAMVLVGDNAQLPPVGQPDSPAMNPERLRQLGLSPAVLTLDIPVRQALESGMLANATVVRNALTRGEPLRLQQNRTDFTVISSAELADTLTSSWSREGQEETLLITRSNYRANRYNAEIRNRILCHEAPIVAGEKLIVAKNNYYAVRDHRDLGFIANGEVIDVEWVGKPEKAYGRYFVDIDFRLQGSERLLSSKVMLRSLVSEGPAIPKAEMDALYARVLATKEGAATQQMKAVDDDPHFNALQVKYAYAVTCHKAQGGQWRDVYVDCSGIDPAAMDATFLRWLYTALTRATNHIYLINPTFPVD